MSKNILITGGSGFIGSHFIHNLLSSDNDYKVFNFDNLSYAGDPQCLKSIGQDKRYNFTKGDIRNIENVKKAFSYNIDIVVNFAAETHVDNSIRDPFIFEEINTRGVLNLLNSACECKVDKFIQISTDEVYGDIEEGEFGEESQIQPNSPYSASKAAADLFVRAYIRTYNLRAIIIRCSNNYGPWQYPEKFIPVIIYKALRDEKVPIYAKGLNIREWLYVTDCAKGIKTVLEKGKIGEIYNIGSGIEKKNIDVAKEILKTLGKPENLIEFVKDRPGHDYRYSLNFSKIRQLGWQPQYSFEKGMLQTANWYKNNLEWLENKVKPLQDYWKELYVKEKI